MIRCCFVLSLGLLLTGCDQGPAPASDTQSAAWLLSERPTNVMTIREAKQKAEFNQEIALRGRIGGRAEPLTNHTPVFVMIDDTDLKPCDPERCNTHWDFCCEPQERIAAHSATIHLAGGPDSGQIDPTSGGLAANDEIIVVGRVGPRPDEAVLTLTATGVYRVKP